MSGRDDPGLADRLVRILRDEYSIDGLPTDLEAIVSARNVDPDELFAWAEENAALELLIAEATPDPNQ